MIERPLVLLPQLAPQLAPPLAPLVRLAVVAGTGRKQTRATPSGSGPKWAQFYGSTRLDANWPNSNCLKQAVVAKWALAIGFGGALTSLMVELLSFYS